MRLFVLAMVGLLFVALAGLEVVMSALPDEPIAVNQVRQGPDGDGNGFALPAEAAGGPAVVCSSTPLDSPAIEGGSSGF